jgi:hypothetical protein
MPIERFARLFRPDDMRLPETWGKVDLASAPAEVRRAIERNGPTPELSSPEMARRRIALYYASLAQMDEGLGKVLTAMRDLNLERNTVVVYTSDHGEMLGDHGLWQKFQFYEGSGGVPLLVRVPGVTPAGTTSCRIPVSHVQVLPTLAELCDVPVPPDLDGKSIAGQLRSPSTVRPGDVYSEYALGSRRMNPRRAVVRNGGGVAAKSGVSRPFKRFPFPRELWRRTVGGHNWLPCLVVLVNELEDRGFGKRHDNPDDYYSYAFHLCPSLEGSPPPSYGAGEPRTPNNHAGPLRSRA